jgi:hypothetical protein
MDVRHLVELGRDVQPLVEGVPPWRVDPAIHDLFERQEWEVISVLMLSCAEATARIIIARLLELRVYDPLTVAACLRRHIRTQPVVVAGTRGQAAARVFRDIDAESEGKASVPDFIREDIEDMAESAARTRDAQMARGDSMDRSPVREFIINRLGERASVEAAAMDALVTVTLAAGWEETRRLAAMKIGNSPQSLARLVAAGRTEELIKVATETQLTAVMNRVAEAMAADMDGLRQRGDEAALAFIAENHPDEGVKASARGEGG